MQQNRVVSRDEWLAARGPEELIGTLMILDRAPKGRNETTTMDFVRRHDEYQDAPRAQ
jgi:predicted dithiol-disulfide oxidoreductase (DUF899 family)